jgi:hypothetical protein
MSFPCCQCGCCCRHVNLSAIYTELDRGDGVCKYLSGNLCSIYKERPLLCRVDESYERFFSKDMSREEFYRLNLDVCEKLQKMEG